MDTMRVLVLMLALAAAATGMTGCVEATLVAQDTGGSSHEEDDAGDPDTETDTGKKKNNKKN